MPDEPKEFMFEWLETGLPFTEEILESLPGTGSFNVT
jgi:hypothetical protein